MSKALVRTSLELFGYENNVKKDTKSKKRRNKSTKGALDLIPIEHRIISTKNKKQTIKLSRSSKLNVEEAKKRQSSRVDSTEENVKRLLRLSNQTLDPETSERLFGRALKKSQVFKETPQPEEEKTAFTEEDFEKFEEEYCEL